MIDLLNWIEAHGTTSLFIGAFGLMAIEVSGLILIRIVDSIANAISNRVAAPSDDEETTV